MAQTLDLLSKCTQKVLASMLLKPSAHVPLGPKGLDEPDLAEVQQAGAEASPSRLLLR